MVNNCINNILSLLYPATCRLCGDHGSNRLDICDGCLGKLPVNDHCCSHCALPLPVNIAARKKCMDCRRKPPPFDRILAPYVYQQPVDSLITSLKYGQQLVNSRLLGVLLADYVLSRSSPLPQLLLPIPAHPKRLRERGFNQASELARQVARRLKLPWRSTLISRNQWTPPQQTLSRQQRLNNVCDSFQCRPVKGIKHVALIDDVVTTGATVSAAAMTLRDAGVERVDIWAVARTPR